MSKKGDPRNKTFFKKEQAYKAWLNGHSFVAHTAELLASPAWRARSEDRYLVRFIDCLELQHCRHNGLENGHLLLTCRQMQKAGISARFIERTIERAEDLGLVTVTHRGSYRGGARNNPSRYRLNYLPWKFEPAVGPPVYYPPIDEWKNYTGKTASQKSVRMFHSGETTSDHPGETIDTRIENKNHAASAKSAARVNVSPGWKRSSILRSTKGNGTNQPADPSSVARWTHVGSPKPKNVSAGSGPSGGSSATPSANPTPQPSRSRRRSS